MVVVVLLFSSQIVDLPSKFRVQRLSRSNERIFMWWCGVAIRAEKVPARLAQSRHKAVSLSGISGFHRAESSVPCAFSRASMWVCCSQFLRISGGSQGSCRCGYGFRVAFLLHLWQLRRNQCLFYCWSNALEFKRRVAPLRGFLVTSNLVLF